MNRFRIIINIQVLKSKIKVFVRATKSIIAERLIPVEYIIKLHKCLPYNMQYGFNVWQNAMLYTRILL